MTTHTPRTDAVIQSPNSYFMVRLENLCRELERELTEKSNEVARLRELCSRLIAKLDHSPYCRLSPKSRPCDCHVSKASAELETLAPAPEEPVIQENRITEPVPLEPEKQLPAGYKGTRRWDEEPAPEWRELGKDEVICEGDEEPKDGGGWMPVLQCYVGRKAKGRVYPVRTSRPLPVIQENRITEPASDDYMLGCDPNEEPLSYEEPTSEWRELGPDEVICDGDEYCSHSYVKWRSIEDDLHNTQVHQWSGSYRFRTLRPLPPEEPVIQDFRITQPVTKRVCKDCGQPHSKHTLHPYETICPEPVSECHHPDIKGWCHACSTYTGYEEPNHEWRELTAEEIVREGDEFQYGKRWYPVNNSIGNKAGHTTRFRTRILKNL